MSVVDVVVCGLLVGMAAHAIVRFWPRGRR